MQHYNPHRLTVDNMTSFKQAFALSKDEVKNATPPGTATLVGTFQASQSIISLMKVLQSTLNGLPRNRVMMKSDSYLNHLRIPQTL